MPALTARIFDDRPCTLGEGLLWHPLRQQLFWFDILGQRLMSRDAAGAALEWAFDGPVSAAGWVDETTLLVASDRALMRFDLATGAREDIAPLEADRPETRSNDGRADPWGGFWIGTMGKRAEPEAGAIYRYWRGELRRLFAPLGIPNAICFDAARECAYFCDTPRQQILRQRLDPANGWPKGEPELFVDLSGEGLFPDGAVVDADGQLWNAQWGAARVACYAPDGAFLGAASVPARHSSCPAFGGPALETLFCTSARQGLGPETLASEPHNGLTFAISGTGRGVAEPRVEL